MCPFLFQYDNLTWLFIQLCVSRWFLLFVAFAVAKNERFVMITRTHRDMQTCRDTHSDRNFSCTVPPLLADDVHSISLFSHVPVPPSPSRPRLYSLYCWSSALSPWLGGHVCVFCMRYRKRLIPYNMFGFSPLSLTLSPWSVSKCFFVLPSFLHIQFVLVYRTLSPPFQKLDGTARSLNVW